MPTQLQGGSKIDLSVVAPVFNEAGNLRIFVERLQQSIATLDISWELILINDGSSDQSMSLIRQLASEFSFVHFIDFSRNFGHPVAVSAGLDFAEGKAVVVIDADLQDPPEEIIRLYQEWKKGFEVVYAQRLQRNGENFLKKASASAFYRFLSWVTPFNIPLDTGDFRIMSRRVVEVIRNMPESQKFLRGQVAWVGFNQSYIQYERAERNAGSSAYSYRKMIRFAWDGITAFSTSPLKLVTVLGFITSFIAFVVGIYALYARYILQDYVAGWPSLMISILFIGGIQMIAIGIIGEYLSRIHINVQKRPLYIIRDKG